MIRIDKRYYIADNKIWHDCGFFSRALRLFFDIVGGYFTRESNISIHKTGMIYRWADMYHWSWSCSNCERRVPAQVIEKLKFVAEDLTYTW